MESAGGGPGAFAGRPVPAPEVAAPPVVLRRYRGDEAPQLLEAVLVSRERLRPWLAFASAEPLDEEIARFVERAAAEFDRAENFAYKVVDPASGTVVGSSGLHPRRGPGRLEIGYWVRTGWTGRGLASAATSALTSAAFALPGIEVVEVRCDEANRASAAVARRLGFLLAEVVDEEPQAPGESGHCMVWVMGRDAWSSGGPSRG